MPRDVRIWEIKANEKLSELRKARLDLEERIERWLEQDISIVSDDLLVIGRQVATDFGGVIDLLCLDRNGDTVIVELKRDKTPRDITAQVLDYASWVQYLSHERITEIAAQHLGDRGPLEEAFELRFGDELPETLNGHHKMLIVASEMDPSTERIINYLSDTYGVDINALDFSYFRQEDERELLARVFLIDPTQVEQSKRIKTASKRKPNLTPEELLTIAEENDVGDLYAYLAQELEPLFDYQYTTMSSLGFIGIIDDNRRTIFSLVPVKSDLDQGLHFQVYLDRLVSYLNADKEQVMNAFPAGYKVERVSNGTEDWLKGYFQTLEDANHCVSALNAYRRE